MARIIHAQNQQELDELDSEDILNLRPGEDARTAIITDHESLYGHFDDVADEEALTIVELPPAGLGGGWDIWNYIQLPVVPIAVAAVGIFAKGALERAGNLFTDAVIKKFADHDLPTQIHVVYPETGSTLVVVIPKRVKIEQAIQLNPLINEEVKKLPDGAYKMVFYAPEEGKLIPF